MNTKPLRSGFLAATLLFSVAAQSRAADYIQDFDGFANGTTDLGDGSQMNGTAVIQDGQLRLTTDGVAGGFASFNIPALADSSMGFVATFDLTITDGAGANEPADGLSFNYGNFTLGELGSAEEGMGGVGSVTENLSFEIDTWMNLDTEQGVNIAEKSGGADLNLVHKNGSILADGTTVSGTVTLSWNPTNGASFTTTGLLTNADFVDIATSFTPSDDYLFGISGRVGGANETKLIDNLVVSTGTPGDSDGDGLSDIYELANGLDPNDDGTTGESAPGLKDGPNGALGDPDMDNLTNEQERDLGTDPQDDDTDSDGLTDDVETNTGVWVSVSDTGTNPLLADSDNDSLLDGVENPDLPHDPGNPTTQPGTDPNKVDTDDDTVSDGAEIAQGRDPTVFQQPPRGYFNDFDGFADGTTDLGDGTIISGPAASIFDGQLRLTQDGVAQGFSSFSIPPIEGSSKGWIATFDLTIEDGPGANEPADGMSLNYGNAALGTLGSAEEGMAGEASVTENLSFEIDTWMNLDPEQGVNIAEKVAGADLNLAFTNGSILADGTSVSGTVVISWDPDGASFATTGLLTNANFVDVPTTFAPDDSHTFIISARVGGANQTLLIDNLNITTDLGPPLNPLGLAVRQVGGQLELSWNSEGGNLYDLLSELPNGDTPPTLPTPAESWPIFGAHSAISATPPRNTLTIPVPADPERYFIIKYYPTPPTKVFSDDFESGQGSWTVSRISDTGATQWELGAPDSGLFGGPPAANSGTNCFGTDLDANYVEDTLITLRSPAIDTSGIASGQVVYHQWRDLELMFDSARVRILDASDLSEIAILENDIDGSSTEWEEVTHDLPPEALNKMIILEFTVDTDEFGNQAGFYLDDICVQGPPP